MWLKFHWVALTALLLNLSQGLNFRNNVCETNEEYLLAPINSHCRYNPDVHGIIGDIANRHGYDFEEYEVTTKDGYNLKLFRIPSSKENSNENKTKQPMLIMHGIARDARCWTLLGKNSPAFHYVDLGYDVWLGNSRGTPYSVEMQKNKNSSYWDFSFHEMGIHDVPAFVEFISEKTNQKGNLIYMAHSMGTTMAFIYSSLFPDHAKEYVKAMIFLAPIAKIHNVRAPLVKEIAQHYEPLVALTKLIHLNHLTTKLDRLCMFYPNNIICQFALQVFIGFSSSNLYPQLMPMLTNKGNAPIGIKILAHYAQIVKSDGKFRQYDYGHSMNRKKYGSATPPDYPVEKILTPVHLIYANNDYIATKDDTQAIYPLLTSNKTILEIPRDSKETLSHGDFLYAKYMNQELYDPIETILKMYD